MDQTGESLKGQGMGCKGDKGTVLSPDLLMVRTVWLLCDVILHHVTLS